MELNLRLLKTNLEALQSMDTVPKGDTNPYLIRTVIEPLLAGKKLRYGDIDLGEFELDDLRRAAGYCEDICRTSRKLEELVANMAVSQAAATKTRTFC